MAPYDFEHGLINASFGEHDEPLVLELTCFQLPFRGHWGVKKPAGRSCVLFCDNKIAIEDCDTGKQYVSEEAISR
jgi:hypothetical protein